MRRRFVFLAAGTAAAVLAVAGIAGVAAQTTDDPDSGPLSSFVDRLAGKLGIGSDELQTAIEATRNDMIDEAVTNGRITPEQAEELKARALGEGLRDGKGFEFRRVGPGDGPRHGFGIGPGPFGGALPEAAEIIGIDVETLVEEMQGGSTLAEVAAAHGVDRDELKQGLTDRYGTQLDRLLDHSFEAFEGRFKFDPGSEDATPMPSSTGTSGGGA